MSDRRDELTKILGANVKANLPRLQKLLNRCNGETLGGIDGVYRFYHKSFKVFIQLQPLTLEIVDLFKEIGPPPDPGFDYGHRVAAGRGELNRKFLEIVADGTGRSFKDTTNDNWLAETRPIVEAFFHAKYFLEMIIKHGETLNEAPGMMKTGYAAVLHLYNLR